MDRRVGPGNFNERDFSDRSYQRPSSGYRSPSPSSQSAPYDQHRSHSYHSSGQYRRDEYRDGRSSFDGYSRKDDQTRYYRKDASRYMRPEGRYSPTYRHNPPPRGQSPRSPEHRSRPYHKDDYGQRRVRERDELQRNSHEDRFFDKSKRVLGDHYKSQPDDFESKGKTTTSGPREISTSNNSRGRDSYGSDLHPSARTTCSPSGGTRIQSGNTMRPLLNSRLSNSSHSKSHGSFSQKSPTSPSATYSPAAGGPKQDDVSRKPTPVKSMDFANFPVPRLPFNPNLPSSLTPDLDVEIKRMQKERRLLQQEGMTIQAKKRMAIRGLELVNWEVKVTDFKLDIQTEFLARLEREATFGYV